MFNPRQGALASLIKWEENGVFSNLELNTVISRTEAPKNDISLYTLLFLGVIEKKMLLDFVISKYSRLNIDEIDTQTKNALRLGIYQLLFCDKIPDYSAVDESVSLVPKRTRGFVNAILRSFLRDDKKIDLPKDKWDKLSIEASMPKEIIDIFISSYGEENAYKLCSLEPKKSPLCLRVNTLKTTDRDVIDTLLVRGGSAEKSSLARDIVKTDLPISQLDDLISGGLVYVQDESSRIASEVLSAKSGDLVADVCACPGGKSFSIAIDMENKGALYASDLHESKLSLITKGAKRLGIDIISTRVQNAKEYKPEGDILFDKILCDVPCSGLGVIFKKPDIKYKSTEAYKSLPDIQYEILCASSRYLKKGGVLVYSTCTLNRAENEANVEKFLSQSKDFLPYDFDIGEIKSKDGSYTFLPHVTSTDGFFVARMRKKDE